MTWNENESPERAESWCVVREGGGGSLQHRVGRHTRTREEGILADPMETQQRCCSALPAVLKKKISWNDHLREIITLPTSQFKFINFHPLSQATFSSHFLSKEHTFFWCPWLNSSKSGAFPPDFSLHSISSPLKSFLDTLFSSPCLGIYLAGLIIDHCPSYRKWDPGTNNKMLSHNPRQKWWVLS